MGMNNWGHYYLDCSYSRISSQCPPYSVLLFFFFSLHDSSPWLFPSSMPLSAELTKIELEMEHPPFISTADEEFQLKLCGKWVPLWYLFFGSTITFKLLVAEKWPSSMTFLHYLVEGARSLCGTDSFSFTVRLKDTKDVDQGHTWDGGLKLIPDV